MKGLPQSPCGVTSPLLEEERMDLGEFSTCILCKEGKRWRDKWEFVPRECLHANWFMQWYLLAVTAMKSVY